jgi:hypothetical protein
MSKEPIIYLKHILDECSFIRSVITPEKSQSEFLNDEIPIAVVGVCTNDTCHL